MTRVTAARNKARSKEDEKDVARILGATRHWADTGGPEDCAHPVLCIQVKGGKAVVNDTLREGMASAKAGAAGTSKLPCVVLVDRKGTRVKRYVVFELEAYADHEGYGP
jgi:hypothetical protein